MSQIIRPGFLIHGGSIGDITYITDSGDAKSFDAKLNIIGTHNITTSGASNTITISDLNSHTLGDIAPIPLGVDALTAQTGDIEVVTGNIRMNSPNSSGLRGVLFQDGTILLNSLGPNDFFGRNVGNLSLGTARQHIGIGSNIFNSLTDVPSANNTAIGHNIGNSLTTGASLTMIGKNIANAMVTRRWLTAVGINTLNSTNQEFQTAIGTNAGSNLGASGQNNLYFAHAGVAGESNTIRIGTQGSGSNQHNRAFIAGIHGVTLGGTLTELAINEFGQVGDNPSPGSGSGLQSLFLAELSSDESNITGDGAIHIVGSQSGWSITTNIGSDFSGTTYTAPSSGVYYFFGHIQLSGITSAMTVGSLELFTTSKTINTGNVNPAALRVVSLEEAPMIIMRVFQLAAGDTVQLRVQVHNGAGDTAGVRKESGSGGVYTRFQGQLLRSL